MMPDDSGALSPIATPLADLKPHPLNYRTHPEDQRAHIRQSLRENGFYKNVVAARDGTILAGHGVVEAARDEGLDTVPVVFLDVGPQDPRALKILTGDNEMSNLGIIDDRLLTEVLRDVREKDSLLGTGFDDMMLANLVMITRPASEIRDFDAAAEWVGLPEYNQPDKPLVLIVSFRSAQDRERFAEHIGLRIMSKREKTWTTWWPDKERDDLTAFQFTEHDEAA